MASNYIYITIEVSKRELDGKLLFCVEASKKGWICVLGSRQHFMKHIRALPKGIWLVKSATNIDLPYIKIAKKFGHKVICLDEEGLVVHSLDYFVQYRLTNDTLRELDMYFTWGNKQLNACKNKYHEFEDKLYSTGNPKADFWCSDNNELLKDELEEIRNKYDKYILVPTSFAAFNHYLGLEERIRLLSRIYKLGEDDIKKQYAYTDFVSHQFEGFKVLINKLDTEISYPIVIRVHPSENVKVWEEFTRPLKNVVIDKQFSTSALIAGSSLLVQSESSTAVEAYLKGKPVIFYSPSSERELNVHQLELPAKVSLKIKQIPEVINVINSLMSGEKIFCDYLNKEKIDLSLSEWIENINGESAIHLMTEYLSKLKINTKHNGVPLIENKFKKIHHDWIADFLTLIRNRPKVWSLLSADMQLRIQHSWLSYHGNLFAQILDYLNNNKKHDGIIWKLLPRPIKDKMVNRHNHLDYGREKHSLFNLLNIKKSLTKILPSFEKNDIFVKQLTDKIYILSKLN